ncbi:ribosome biogenesis protein RLP24 [Culex quinquefasciatus]|uniref:Probable ribosome biogenesis protein RLP24 n=1 Tax=Culex quinquefasciatus TaxID=7176 RepID=B0WNU9_CULQU|nr:ribosome biogenesis protein RLP24 [Culex quinquefasciatus]|eukprot:XP_001850383.1 ribosome biogenesis protein RLP24 [Culex quinquefasciatus]
MLEQGHGMVFVRNDCKVFRFCCSKRRRAFNRKKNPRKICWTKAYRKTNGKELTIDPAFESEKRRNVPVKYNRELWSKTIDSIKKITEIRERRERHFVMERLRKTRDREIHNDIVDVQKNISLIRSPAIGLRERRVKEKAQQSALLMDVEGEEEEEEQIEYVDARQFEKQLEESGGLIEDDDAEMMKA